MLELASSEIVHRVKEYYEIRFGINTDIFNQYAFYTGPRGRIFLGPKTNFPLDSIDTLGILVVRLQKTVKPTTNFFQLFGKLVTKNNIVLNENQTTKYCSGEDDTLSIDEIGEATRGFVMVSYDNIPLGCALLIENELINQLPNQNRIKLQYF
ncbi:MAG: hypothetical protein ABIJ12_00600 [bacterium]